MTDHKDCSAEICDLKPCPFCGNELYRSPRTHNPKAYCVTEDCYGKRMSVVNLDDPIILAMWNRRSGNDAQSAQVRDPNEIAFELCEKWQKSKLDVYGTRTFSLDEISAFMAGVLAAIPSQPSPAATVDLSARRYPKPNGCDPCNYPECKCWESQAHNGSSADSSKVRAILDRYAPQHDDDCIVETWHGKGPMHCSCGLYDAMGELEALTSTEPQPAQVPPSPEFARVVNAMSDWRNADHEDMLTLSRHQAIVILEGIKALSLSRPHLARGE